MNKSKKAKNRFFATFFMFLSAVAASAITPGTYDYEHKDEHGVIWYFKESPTQTAPEVSIFGNKKPSLADVTPKGRCTIVGWNDDQSDGNMIIPGTIIVKIRESASNTVWKGWIVDEVSSSGMTEQEVIHSTTSYIMMPKKAKVKEKTFKGMSNLRTVIIGDWESENIPASLFQGCSNLSQVIWSYSNNGIQKVNNSIKHIGDYAFQGCTSLLSVDLAKSAVETIGYTSFEGCGSIATLTLPASLKTIGKVAFRYNYSLESIDFSGTQVTEISDEAFRGCAKLSEVTLNSKITRIGSQAFRACGIKVFHMPETVGEIGDLAFGGESYLDQPLQAMYFTHEVSPKFIGNPFRGTNANAKLYVPVDCSSSYKTELGTSRIGKYNNAVGLARDRVREQMTISKYGYKSYYLETENFQVPMGVTAYVVTGRNNNKRTEVITYDAGAAVPAKNGFFLYAPDNKNQTIEYEAHVEASKEIAVSSANLMQGTRRGTIITAPEGGKCYILAAGPTATQESVGFWYQGGTEGKNMTLKPHSAGLVLEASLALSKGFTFEEIFKGIENKTTGIEAINSAEGTVAPKTIYDLQGRKVENPTRGIYIVNGKKIVIK